MINQKIAQAAKEYGNSFREKFSNPLDKMDNTLIVHQATIDFEAGAAKYAELLSGGVELSEANRILENASKLNNTVAPSYIEWAHGEMNKALHASQAQIAELKGRLEASQELLTKVVNERNELKAENERLNNLLKDKAIAAKEVITGLLDKATERITSLESQLKEMTERHEIVTSTNKLNRMTIVELRKRIDAQDLELKEARGVVDYAAYRESLDKVHKKYEKMFDELFKIFNPFVDSLKEISDKSLRDYDHIEIRVTAQEIIDARAYLLKYPSEG